MSSKPVLACDTECYKDWWLIKFRNADTGVEAAFELYPGSAPLDVVMINLLLYSAEIVTFNGNNYDLPMISLALRGSDCATLKYASDRIIKGKLKPWDFEREFGVQRLIIDHVDVMEVAPGDGGLKAYGGRVHSRKLQDLPIEPDAFISPADRVLLSAYCSNDLVTTLDLRRKLLPQLALREAMGAEYGIDVRSKSDAQIAEAVFKAKLGRKIEKPHYPAGTVFRYTPPAWLVFQSLPMQTLVREVWDSAFEISDKGKIVIPPALAKRKIAIGAASYKLGIGGLHSSEKSAFHMAGDGWTLSDHDVASYYPTMILNQGLSPQQIGPEFQAIYRAIYNDRLADKRAKNKTGADTKKIVLNGTFGKLNSVWSIFYSPDLLIQTTITGQLSLLMLIEALEMAGVQVVNANTDGIVVKLHVSQHATRDAIVKWWEAITGYETEETKYRALYSRDVNTYLAVKIDGSVKGKGAFADEGLAKNPTNAICTEAVSLFVSQGVPMELTIGACQDVRQFVSVRHVDGGAVKDDAYLGKDVRWYYAKGETGTINYKRNGYLVARSEGGRPLMELPDACPADLDRDWYIREAYDILADMGVKAA